MEKKIAHFLMTHVTVQLGTYFSECKDLSNNLKYAYSNSIEDYYWNYAFCLQNKLNPGELKAIRNFSNDINRTPYIYLLDEQTYLTNDLYNVLESEIWMINEKLEPSSNFNDRLVFKKIVNEAPDEDFLKVFDNAYGGGEKGSVGYSGLPAEYTNSLRCSNAKLNGVKIVHIVGYFKNNPVAVASLYSYDNTCGLYNVGVIASNRLKKFGTQISVEALKVAGEIGCNNVFLQTKSGSEVEALYKKIGFATLFQASFVELKS